MTHIIIVAFNFCPTKSDGASGLTAPTINAMKFRAAKTKKITPAIFIV